MSELVPNDGPDLERSPFTWKTLHAIANTEFVPKTLRGNPAAILACILTGRELGLGPMESMRSIDIIDGKPSPTSEWMLSRVFDAGHLVYATEQTAESCTVVGVRRERTAQRIDGYATAGEPVEVARASFAFTIDMARRAGLTNKSNWKNYPEAMLYWRAVAQLCRQLFPDVLRGIKYLPDELGDADWQPPTPLQMDEETGEILEHSSDSEDALAAPFEFPEDAA